MQKGNIFYINVFIYIREIKERENAMQTLLFSSDIANKYKETSDAIQENINYKPVIKKSLSGLLKQSFFHGATRFGVTNFIA